MSHYTLLGSKSSEKVAPAAPFEKILNKGEILEALDAKRSVLFWALSGLAVVGVILTVVEVEVLWENSNAPDIGCQMIKLFVSLSTLSLCESCLLYIEHATSTTSSGFFRVTELTSFFCSLRSAKILFNFVRNH